MRSMPTFKALRWRQEGLVPSVFAGSLLAASCGGAPSVEQTSAPLEICVDVNGEIVPGGTCGEDHQCRDDAGFVIEGTMCIEEPNMCTGTDTTPPEVTVHGATRNVPRADHRA